MHEATPATITSGNIAVNFLAAGEYVARANRNSGFIVP